MKSLTGWIAALLCSAACVSAQVNVLGQRNTDRSTSSRDRDEIAVMRGRMREINMKLDYLLGLERVQHKEEPLTDTDLVFPWSNIVFGVSFSGSTVTIHNCEAVVGASDYVTIADQSRSVNDGDYVGAEYTYNTEALSITTASSDKPRPESDGTVWRLWLYRFGITNSEAYVSEYGNFGRTLEIPAGTGP